MLDLADVRTGSRVLVQEVTFCRHFSSIPGLIRRLKESAFLRQPIEKLGEVECEQAWVEVEQELSQLEGRNGVEIPASCSSGSGPSKQLQRLLEST
jgi:hypothetical protein